MQGPQGHFAGSQEKRGQCLQNKAALRGQRLGMGFGGLAVRAAPGSLSPGTQLRPGMQKLLGLFCDSRENPFPSPFVPWREQIPQRGSGFTSWDLSSCCLSQVQGDPIWVEGSLFRDFCCCLTWERGQGGQRESRYLRRQTCLL